MHHGLLADVSVFPYGFCYLQPELVVDFPARFTDLQDTVKCLMLLFPRNARCPPHPFPVLLFASCFPSSPCFLSCPFPLSPVLWLPVVLLLLVLFFPWHSLFFSSLTLALPLLFLSSQLISHPPCPLSHDYFNWFTAALSNLLGRFEYVPRGVQAKGEL